MLFCVDELKKIKVWSSKFLCCCWWGFICDELWIKQWNIDYENGDMWSRQKTTWRVLHTTDHNYYWKNWNTFYRMLHFQWKWKMQMKNEKFQELSGWQNFHFIFVVVSVIIITINNSLFIFRKRVQCDCRQHKHIIIDLDGCVNLWKIHWRHANRTIFIFLPFFSNL